VTVSILPPTLRNGFKEEADSILPEADVGIVKVLVVVGR
jgi:hypothetical protein